MVKETATIATMTFDVPERLKLRKEAIEWVRMNYKDLESARDLIRDIIWSTKPHNNEDKPYEIIKQEFAEVDAEIDRGEYFPDAKINQEIKEWLASLE